VRAQVITYAELEGEEFRVASEWSLEQGDVDALADAGWARWLFWWIAGTYIREGRRLMDRVLAHDAGFHPVPGPARSARRPRRSATRAVAGVSGRARAQSPEPRGCEGGSR
jgi:hypothetical protein